MYDADDIERLQVAEGVHQDLVAFLQPLLDRLDAQIDRRLVRTFARTIAAILCFRNRPHGLLLSELGVPPQPRPCRRQDQTPVQPLALDQMVCLPERALLVAAGHPGA